MSKIKGTLVYHLPFNRNEYLPPQITLVFRKIQKVYNVGLSVCSRNDQFSRKIGLTKANGNLHSEKAIHSFDVDDLLKQIQMRLQFINGNHGNITADVFNDVNKLRDKLESMKAKNDF